ncbi:hypothetical protein AABB24_035633, partial [Solanum stoloniferum]
FFFSKEKCSAALSLLLLSRGAALARPPEAATSLSSSPLSPLLLPSSVPSLFPSPLSPLIAAALSPMEFHQRRHCKVHQVAAPAAVHQPKSNPVLSSSFGLFDSEFRHAHRESSS